MGVDLSRVLSGIEVSDTEGVVSRLGDGRRSCLRNEYEGALLGGHGPKRKHSLVKNHVSRNDNLFCMKV